MVLVLGSTGQLGRTIVKRLRQDGVPVRALVRSSSNTSVLPGSGVELVIGDLRDPESLRQACRGCDALITTANSLRSRLDLERVDREGNLNLIEAAKRENVGHFVFTSTIGADAPDAPTVFRSKRFVEESLAGSGLRYTILRPAGFMENLTPLIRAAQRSGWALLLGPGKIKSSLVAMRDIAEMARLVLAKSPETSSVVEFGGPEDLCARDCMAQLQEVLGRRIHVVSLPLGLLRLVGRVMRPFNPSPEGILEIISFAERNGLRTNRSFLSRFPIPLTSFRSFLQEIVEAQPPAR